MQLDQHPVHQTFVSDELWGRAKKQKKPWGKQSLADQQTTSRVTNHPYFQYDITIFNKSLKKIASFSIAML